MIITSLKICVWEHKASSLYNGTNLHLLSLELPWQPRENQRLINASNHNLLAAVQVACDSVSACVSERY